MRKESKDEVKKKPAITMTAVSLTMMLTACSGTTNPQPASVNTPETDSADASESSAFDTDINLDALNESVQTIQNLDLTTDVSTEAGTDAAGDSEYSASEESSSATEDASSSATEDASSSAAEDAYSETSDTSDEVVPKGDYTPYSYADVYINGDDITVIPNGQLNASTVLFEDKELAGFLDYIDSKVLEEGRTINRELFYELLSTMLVDKDLVSDPVTIEKYMMMALAIANNFHNLDVSVKECCLDANNAADYNYTVKTSGREDIWLINYEKRTIYMNNGNTEYVSDLFKDEYLAVWLMAIEDYYGINYAGNN